MDIPVVTTPLPDECFKSWVHRLASPYLVSPVVLLNKSLGQSVDMGLLKFSDLIGIFSSISKVPANELSDKFKEDVFASKYLSSAKSKPSLWKVRLPKKSCPICWDEDRSSNLPTYFRREWLEPWRIVCPKHNALLQDHVLTPSKNGLVYSYNKKTFGCLPVSSILTSTLSGKITFIETLRAS